MSGVYPYFKPCYTHEELVEHFLLTPTDLQLVLTCPGDANRCGMALLLKALAYLGYVPERLDRMPAEVRSFIAGHWLNSNKGTKCEIEIKISTRRPFQRAFDSHPCHPPRGCHPIESVPVQRLSPIRFSWRLPG
jgi:Domain of unknown function (DUF4158)